MSCNLQGRFSHQLRRAIKTNRSGNLIKDVSFHQHIATAHRSVVLMAALRVFDFEIFVSFPIVVIQLLSVPPILKKNTGLGITSEEMLM